MVVSLTVVSSKPRSLLKPLARILESSLGCVLLLSLPPFTAVAEQITQAKVIEILDKPDQVFIQNQVVQKNAVGTLGQQVRTAEARASLKFDVKAGVRLNKNTSFVIGDDCVRLFKGQVLIAGNTGKRGCVGKIEVKTVGTVYLLQMDDNNQGRVVVLEGKVEVFNPETPAIKPVVVGAGQAVDVSPAGEVGGVQTLSQAQLQTTAAPLIQDFQVPLPDLDKITVLERRDLGFTATFLRDALVGADEFDTFDGPKQQATTYNLSGTSIPGVFQRTGNNTGTFTPSSGPLPVGVAIPITVDFDNRSLTFGAIPGVVGQPVESSLGLTGNNASGTVIFSNGQVVRVEAFGVNGSSPSVGSTYPGQITIAPGQNIPGPALRDR